MAGIRYVTLGCKANQYDTGAMEALLTAHGYPTCGRGEVPQAVVVNSCTVTEESDRKTRQTLRRMGKQYPDALLVLCGCSAQRDPESYLEMDEVDCVLGTGNREAVLFAVEQGRKGEKLNLVEEPSHFFEEMGVAATHRTRGYLKIQDGCDRYCSYCIIPKVRGPVRSREMDNLVKEAGAMAESGIREIVLTGIRLISFGRDRGESLMDAVEAVAALPGVERIRLGSLDPDEVDGAFIRRAAAEQKLCHHFHLSLQSGCDAVLHRMNRRYTTGEFRAVADGIRAAMPDAGITTDVLCGFVGETEEEHRATCRFLREVGFSRLHVFPYSKRAGTVAAGLPGHLSRQVKQERARELIALGEELESAFVQRFLGQKLRAVFETREGDALVGYTGNYIRVSAPGARGELGRSRTVDIIGERRGTALCRPVD